MTASEPTDFMTRVRSGEFILMDGAMGTELERRGVPVEGAGWSALAVRDHADAIRAIHEDYIRLGARLHIVNSFALARHVLEPLGFGADFERFNRQVVQLFEAAAAGLGVDRACLWAAGSLSTFAAYSDRSRLPTGDALVANYRDQAAVLHAAGVDLFAFEMLWDVDVTLAMLRATDEFGLPVILGFTCDRDGAAPARVTTAHSLGRPAAPLEEVLRGVIDAVEPDRVIFSIMHSAADVTDAALETLRRLWDGPVAVYPNSGTFVDLHLQFESVCTAAEFRRAARRWIDAGVGIVGGCCGIGPAHIEALGDLC